MDLNNSVLLLTDIIRYITPFCFLWAIVYRVYSFVMSAITGGHKFM